MTRHGLPSVVKQKGKGSLLSIGSADGGVAQQSGGTGRERNDKSRTLNSKGTLCVPGRAHNKKRQRGYCG